MNPPRSDQPRHVIVVGGGFGGLGFCQHFAHPNARITLLDKRNHHLFVPLLYQVATTGLSAPDIAQPLRTIFSDRDDIEVLMLAAKSIDLDKNILHAEGRDMPYDALVLALGSQTNFFGNPHWAEHAMGLKDLGDAHRIRNRIIQSFEHAETGRPDKAEVRRLMTTVVIGAGPTGVEMAGALAELYQRVFRRDYRNVRPEDARVILIDALPEVLPAFSDTSSRNARRQLSDLGIEVITGKMVKDIQPGCVSLDDRKIDAGNIIWTAGVSANAFTQEMSVEKNKGGQIKVEKDCSVPGHPNVYAIGDMASLEDANGKAVPGLAPAAMQMGKHVAEVLKTEFDNAAEERKPFRYDDRGMLATIGRGKAVGEVKGRKLSGTSAWFIWLGVHLAFLRGLRNRLFVLLQWIFAYITFKPGARLVWETHHQNKPQKTGDKQS